MNATSTGWNRHAHRQTCKVCRRPDKFNFHVPDGVWAAVVPPEFQQKVVCLYCFDDFALQRGVDYASAVHEVWFAGDKATLRLDVGRAIGG